MAVVGTSEGDCGGGGGGGPCGIGGGWGLEREREVIQQITYRFVFVITYKITEY